MSADAVSRRRGTCPAEGNVGLGLAGATMVVEMTKVKTRELRAEGASRGMGLKCHYERDKLTGEGKRRLVALLREDRLTPCISIRARGDDSARG